LHRYGSVPIFDKFDYEKKLEEAIERNYLENNYEHYLFKHKPIVKDASVELAQIGAGAEHDRAAISQPYYKPEPKNQPPCCVAATDGQPQLGAPHSSIEDRERLNRII
jgi:hypothetical protein